MAPTFSGDDAGESAIDVPEGAGGKDSGDPGDPAAGVGGAAVPCEVGGAATAVGEAGSRDAGSREAGSRDARSRDAGSREAGSRDARSRDARVGTVGEASADIRDAPTVTVTNVTSRARMGARLTGPPTAASDLLPDHLAATSVACPPGRPASAGSDRPGCHSALPLSVDTLATTSTSFRNTLGTESQRVWNPLTSREDPLLRRAAETRAWASGPLRPGRRDRSGLGVGTRRRPAPATTR